MSMYHLMSLTPSRLTTLRESSMGQPSSPVNVAEPKPVRSHSTFQPNYSMYQTFRFGEIGTNVAIEGVAGDKLTLNVESDVDTYTLKAPLMTAVRKIQSYAAVPLRTILPRTAELIITNPVIGDDVNAEMCNCGLPYKTLLKHLQTLCTNFQTAVRSCESLTESVLSAYWSVFLRYMPLLSLFVSKGSLLANLGINLSSLFRGYLDSSTSQYVSFDMLFEVFFDELSRASSVFQHESSLSSLTFSMDSFSSEVPLSVDFTGKSTEAVSPRRLLELARDGWYIQPDFEDSSDDGYVFTAGFTSSLSFAGVLADYTEYINFGRAAAYQICCAQFFSNDHVDDIYSADLYRKNMQSLFMSAYSETGDRQPSFQYNGITINYDALSCALIDIALGDVVSDSWNKLGYWFYIMNLFSFQRSLRYGDYFAGAKVSPLAVGDVNVSVDTDSMSVDIIDVTQNIQRQRFLNQVNRVGRKFKSYLEGIFGASPDQDSHEPIWLNEYHDIIGAEETANTGAAQLTDPNSKTSNLRSNTSRYAFDIVVKEPLFIIGFVQFDVPRAYVYGIDRLCLHADRYDMFNPFMQFIGDQVVSGIEILPSQYLPFGYQLRYAEYKERVDRAAGGFAEFLPGYAITFDPSSASPVGYSENYEAHISSDFIRARASEFDGLYASLSHWSPAGYFHFIVRTDIKCDFKRPMAFAPSIL